MSLNRLASIRRAVVPVLLCGALLTGCVGKEPSMDGVAESYVKLVLAMGSHDPDYVDAYYGPEEWRLAALADSLSLDAIETRALQLVAYLEGMPDPSDEMARLRHRYLRRQLASTITRAQMLGGTRLTFDQESAALYDAVAPKQPETHYRRVLTELDRVLPGRGSVQARYERFRNDFVIPPTRLDTVFTAAIVACRDRTANHLELPDGESFTVEYVTDKSWSGYNWYQGGLRSLIQVNTDLPISIDRAVDLACHEGYPGHHTYNAFLEKHLVRDRGWVEYSVYPLFSPQSLIAEGSANFGIAMALPGPERVQFETDVLFPLAGLDAARAAEYYRVLDLIDQLSYAGNDAARSYLDGEITADSAVSWLENYSLMTPMRARQRLRFIEQYRSYVINYNFGKDLVARYVTARARGDRDRAWEVFARLLSSPRVPSDLVADPGQNQ